MVPSRVYLSLKESPLILKVLLVFIASTSPFGLTGTVGFARQSNALLAPPIPAVTGVWGSSDLQVFVLVGSTLFLALRKLGLS